MQESASRYQRRYEDDGAEQGVEFEIVTGPPIPLATRTPNAKVPGWFWIESTGVVHFASSYEQACRDHREYILEVLSA